MNKVYRIAALFLMAGLLVCGPRVMADTIVSVSGPASVSQGDTFAVDVNIADVADLFGFQLDLGFDPAVVQATNVQEGSFLPGGGFTFFIAGKVDNTLGSITNNANSLISAVSGVNGGGTLVEFNFLALAQGTSLFSLSNITLLDSELNPITASSTDGSVTVTGGPVPTP